MNIRTITAKKILTPQKSGFLAQGQYPYTHSLNWATGCGFGNTYCGKYCYAPKIPNWLYNRQPDEAWGDAVIVKENAPDLLDAELSRSRKRGQMRIFMSSVTDPYQPLERKLRMTRACLDVFARYDDLDLLVLQTRSPIVTDDLDYIVAVPYAWLSVTLETNRAGQPLGPNAAILRQRHEAVQQAAAVGIPVQITVSPCLPYDDGFADWLINSGASRFVVDTFVEGDGSGGQRTASSPFGEQADFDWRRDDYARALYEELEAKGATVGWSLEGFQSIPPYAEQMAMDL